MFAVKVTKAANKCAHNKHEEKQEEHRTLQPLATKKGADHSAPIINYKLLLTN